MAPLANTTHELSPECSELGIWNATGRFCLCLPDIPHMVSFNPLDKCAATMSRSAEAMNYVTLAISFGLFIICSIKLARLLIFWRRQRKPLYDMPLVAKHSEAENVKFPLFPVIVVICWLLTAIFFILYSLLLITLQPLTATLIRISLIAAFFPATQMLVISYSIYSAWFSVYFFSLSRNASLPDLRRRGFIIGHAALTAVLVLYSLSMMILSFFPLTISEIEILYSVLFWLSQIFVLSIVGKMVYALIFFRRKFYRDPISRRQSFSRAIRGIYIMHIFLCVFMSIYDIIWFVNYWLELNPADTAISIQVLVYLSTFLFSGGVGISLSTIADREEYEETDAIMYFPIGFFWFPCLTIFRRYSRQSMMEEHQGLLDDSSFLSGGDAFDGSGYDGWGDNPRTSFKNDNPRTSFKNDNPRTSFKNDNPRTSFKNDDPSTTSIS